MKARFTGPVLLIWDHGRWHPSRAVEEAVAQYDRLEVVLLPKRAPQEHSGLLSFGSTPG